MLAIKTDGKKKITFTDLVICGVLGAALVALGHRSCCRHWWL